MDITCHDHSACKLVITFNRSHASIMRDTCHGHSIIAYLRHISMGVVLCAHPVRGESHI